MTAVHPVGGRELPSEGRARAIHDAARDVFRPPPGWRSSRWRKAVVVASGLTALAAEAVLRDAAHRPSTVVRDPAQVPEGGPPVPVLGCSLSGRTAEVLDALRAARNRGAPTALLTMAPPSPTDDADSYGMRIQIPAGPDHRLPLRVAAICAALPPLLGVAGAPSPVGASEAPIEFLADVYRQGIVPVFVVSADGYRVRLLRSLWMELLHRPAFELRFPEWTHDFLWAYQRRPTPPLAFVIEPPARDLSDGRHHKVVAHLRRLGRPIHQLEPTSAGDSPGAVATLLAWMDRCYRLAVDVGSDFTVELAFEPTPGPPS